MPPESRRKRVLMWIGDRFWPSAYGSKGNRPQQPEWPWPEQPDREVLDAALAELNKMVASEADRFRIVETKLQGIASTAPIAMTLVTGFVTFFLSGKLTSFTALSIVAIGGLGGYAAVQFLRAVLAALTGLSRREYRMRKLDSVAPQQNEDEWKYKARTCKELAQIYVEHQEVTNEKVTQLAIGHTAVANAVWALMLLVIVLSAILVWESTARTSGTPDANANSHSLLQPKAASP